MRSAAAVIPRPAEQFQALSDETRLRILDLLRGGEHCVCELTEVLDLRQSLLSFHLKALKDAGLVTDRREGRWMYYALAPEALEALAAHLTGFTRRVAPQRRRAGRCKDLG
jgi:ArsR family transcriptional regulator, arsenate/arsenite/antimonite-responsive transcriptional repressor